MAKILIVAMNYAPEFAGCGKYTGDLALGLVTMGHEVEVITTPPHYPGWIVKEPYRNRYTSEMLDGVQVWRCPAFMPRKMGGLMRLLAPLSYAVTSAPLIVWRIFIFRPKVVLTIEPTLFAAPAALLGATLIGARRIIHVQDLEVDAAFAMGHLAPNRFLMKIGALFEQFCLRHADKVVTISKQMVRKIASKGVKDDRISLVRNWVDLDHIKAEPLSIAMRRELEIPRDAYVALYSGNIGPKQGLGVVIEAARLLKDEKNIIIAIAGDGPSKKKLEDLASDLPNIRFLPFQPYERLGEFLGMCDLHILPQLSSAADLVLPSKLGGMLASGRPIVVTAAPGSELVEFLRDCATVVQPDNPTVLAEAILACACGNNGRFTLEGTLALARTLSRPEALRRIEAALIKDELPPLNMNEL